MDDLEKLRLAIEKNNDVEIQKIREENMREICVTEFYKNQQLHPLEIDSLSQALLPTDLHPVMANCFALKTTGDGNCLYNSFSKLFSGNEDLADRIRLLSALELYQNRTLYANLSHLEEVAKHPETGNGNLEHLFTCLLQDGSLNIYDVAKNREDALTYEALQTCHAGNWAGMFNIMAIATVFNISIYSVYPEACRGIRPLLHRKIDPVSKTDSLPTLEVAIFWTRDGDLDSRRGSMFTPNHFVPLVISKLLVANNETECMESEDSGDEGENIVIQKGAQKESSRKRNALDFGKIQEDLKEDCGCYRECNSQFLNTEIVYRWRVKYHSLPQGFQQQTKLLEMYRDSWSSDCHFVEGMFICRVAWRKTLLRISKRTYSRMVERASSGVLCLANVPKTKSDTRGQICIGFMENFVKYYGDDHPENGNTYLPPGMTLRDVYDRYRDKYKDSKPLKLARFYEIWTKHFKHVKHPKCSNMAKCVVCVFAAELLKSTADPQIRETIRSDFSEHLERQREARQSYYERRDEAISNLDVTSIIVDGMDQAKTHIPHFRDMPKNLDPKNLLQSHITGIITHGKGTKIYLDVSQYPHDSNLTMHCLLNALYDDAEMIEDSDKRCLKKKIYVQLDNCSRENKNKYLLALLALLVKWKKTEEVFVNFLMVGHTHEDIDQRFSLISRRLKRKPTRSIPEFAEEVQQSMDKISVKGVNKVYDVREWLTPFMAIIGGHSEPHSFWIFEKKPGHVALKFKAWPKDIEWLPSGSCLELFKENKDGSQLVPQGVPQVVEPDWAKLELDLVKANLKNIKDLMLDSINNWWTEFFEDPSILRKESEDFWVMDRLSSMKGQKDTGFGSPSVVSPLSYVMEKERKVPMVYNGRKRKIFEEKEQEQDKTEEVMVQHMIVYRENTFIKYGKVIGASNDIVCIQCYRLVGNDILKEVVSRKGDVQTINIKKEHILPNLVFILPASNRIPQRIKLACFDLK